MACCARSVPLAYGTVAPGCALDKIVGCALNEIVGAGRDPPFSISTRVLTSQISNPQISNLFSKSVLNPWLFQISNSQI
jgi:hypothetical protein